MKKHRNLMILLTICTCLILNGNTCSDATKAYETKEIEQVGITEHQIGC